MILIEDKSRNELNYSLFSKYHFVRTRPNVAGRYRFHMF